MVLRTQVTEILSGGRPPRAAACARIASAFALLSLLVVGGCGAPPGRVVVEPDSPAVREGLVVEAISIELSEGELVPILERGCVLPCTEVATFGVADELQSEIVIHVFRGNTDSTDSAVPLGTFEISGFPLVSGEEVEVPVTFGAGDGEVWIEADPGPRGAIRISRVDGGSLDFAARASAYPRRARARYFTARAGAELNVRTYGDTAPVDLILVHGSAAWNAYLSDLAARLADAGVAVVHTPDLRGHGASPTRRGDVDHVDQLEDDLADLIAVLEELNPDRKIVVGGHSSGGGLAVRMAGGAHAEQVDGWLLLAPFLGHDAPTTRPNSGGWARPKLERIIPLSVLNGFGITALNDAIALEFELPESRRTGHETLAYTYRMMAAVNPRGLEADLPRLCAPALVVVGADDEAMVADAYAPAFDEHAPHARVVVVPGAGHLELVAHDAVPPIAIAWLRELAAGEAPVGCR